MAETAIIDWKEIWNIVCAKNCFISPQVSTTIPRHHQQPELIDLCLELIDLELPRINRSMSVSIYVPI